MFENMIDLMFKSEYDVYVFDTAPTANARRLLGMSKVYSLWVNKMLKSREEARTLREMLSFTKKKEADPLMDYLVSFRDRMEHARKLLTDPRSPRFSSWCCLRRCRLQSSRASSNSSRTLAFPWRRSGQHADRPCFVGARR
jgi:anion-transporting  ArsA/GET3 family ATPase